MRIKVTKLLKHSTTYEVDIVLDDRHYKGKLTTNDILYIPDNPDVTQTISTEDYMIITVMIKNQMPTEDYMIITNNADPRL